MYKNDFELGPITDNSFQRPSLESLHKKKKGLISILIMDMNRWDRRPLQILHFFGKTPDTEIIKDH